MKPGKRDLKYEIKIQGDELDALKIVCADMPECFGLDRRIAAYKGTRPIGFYRWDLDALVDTFDNEIRRESKFATSEPDAKDSPALAIYRRVQASLKRRRRIPIAEPAAVASLYARLKALRDKAYEELDMK